MFAMGVGGKMILTQSFAEAGSPAGFSPVGMYADTLEPITEEGYGYGGIKEVTEMFTKQLATEHGIGARIFNAKITTRLGNAHPGYHRVEYTLTGDLYKCTHS
jgi:hypothetical protein